MADKQVIINGCNVSGCPSYMENGECINENVYSDYCKACPNCKYKLEQQLDNLKQTHAEIEGEFRYADGTNEQENYENFINSFDNDDEIYYRGKHYIKFMKRQLKAKEQKCEELIQTLAEIKEIVKQGVKIHDDIIVSKQILQKINEVIPNE